VASAPIAFLAIAINVDCLDTPARRSHLRIADLSLTGWLPALLKRCKTTTLEL
jgi:hypothetical protein